MVSLILPGARIVLPSLHLFVDLGFDDGQIFKVKKTPGRGQRVSEVRVIQPERAEYVGGGEVNKVPLPFDQNRLVQSWGIPRFVMEENPPTHASADPPVTLRPLFLIISGWVKPWGYFKRILATMINRRVDGTFGIHVDHHGEQILLFLAVEVDCRVLDVSRIAVRDDEKFVGVEGKAPVARAVFAKQVIEPVNAEERVLVAGACRPERAVGLLLDKGSRPVIGVVVDKKEVLYPLRTVVFEEIRQADDFIPAHHEG